MSNLGLPRLPGQSQTSWTNWARNQRCSPIKIERPLTEGHLQEVVKQAAASGRKIRPVGTGHSFTAIACTDDVMISLEHLNLVQSIDRDGQRVTAQAGIELSQLTSRLTKAGLAMTNLGDIAYQTLAGAVSTSTHGTGLRFGGLATQIRALRLVTATGDIVDASPTQNAELFHVARVGLGAFGIITEISLAVEPAFQLHAVEGAHPVDEVLDGWDQAVVAHDHYEFFWIPGGELAMTKANRRTDEPRAPQPKHKQFVDKILAENVGFGAMVKLAKYRPSMIPKLASIVGSQLSDAEYTDVSHKVFTSARWVKFVEMEYSAPVADAPMIVRRIAEAVADAGIDLLFPIEVRTAAADDIPLSTAYGRDSAYIAVHRANGQEFRPYFELVEAIMDEFDARPHWGKMHFQTAATLAPRYREWDEFQRLRAAHDPTGVFSNGYTDRVLGSVR